MNLCLLETKFYIPAWRIGEVTRPRLLERLRCGLHAGHQFTLISAPAGYGKTTLVTEWITPLPAGSPPAKVAWLTLDEVDNDPARFARYWLAALHRVDAALGQGLQNLLDLPQTPLLTGLLADLINALAALPYTVMVVLDDYHVIQTPAIHAALSLQGQQPVTEFAEQFSGTHRYIIDYLVEQVLQRQSAEVRTFLVRTAVLDRLCAAMCDTLLQEEGRTRSSALSLAYLEHANLFLIPLDDERRWYRYHQLFADSLRAELDPAEQARLHRRAAQWFAAHALIGEAIQHAYQAQDFVLAAHLIAQHGPATLQRGEVATLLEWLRLLPAELVEANNTLITSQAYTLFFTGQITAARVIIERVFADASPLRDPVTRGRLLALRAWFLALERTVTTGEVARAALALIEPDDALSRSFALLPLGHAQPTNGDLVGSTQTFREAYDEGKRANFRLALPGALYNLAFNLNEQGQRRTALALCEEALARFVDRRGKSLPLAGLAYVPLAVLHYAANELPLAHMYAQKGLELSRPTISGMILGGDAEYILAQVHVAHGERKAALTLLRTMRAAAQHSGMARVADTLWASEADLYLRIGELAPAAHWATTLGFTPDGIAVATSGRHALIYIRLLMAQGYWHDAQTVAARFAAHAHDQGRQLWLIHVQLLQAAIARQFGDGAKATQACRRV